MPSDPDAETAPYQKHLEPGQALTVDVHAEAKWNDTTLELRTGEQYQFQASGRWFDASIECGPAGYKSPSLLFRLAEWLRRAPHADWFALIGAIDKKESTAFLIGDEASLTVTESGVLYCFANDLALKYGNNSGAVSLTVTRRQ